MAHPTARRHTSLDLLDLRQESVVRDQRLPSSQDVLVANDTLLIDDEIRSLSHAPLAIEHPIGVDRLEIGIIADERKVELQIIGERLLGKSQIAADAYNLGVHSLKIAVIVPTGRQFRDSRGGKIEHVKFDQNVFLSLKAAELQLAALRTGQFEIRSFVSNLYCKHRRKHCENQNNGES